MEKNNKKSKKVFKNLFRLLTVVSLLFLGIYLFKLDYLSLKKLSFDPLYLALSLCALFVAFALGGINWWVSLKSYDVHISARVGMVSHCMSVFAKYVPGKVWTVLGRAVYISRYGAPIISTSMISTKLQFENLIIGMILGLMPMLFWEKASYFRFLILPVLVGLLILIGNQKFQKLVLEFGTKIIHQQLIIPETRSLVNAYSLAIIVVQWLFYMVGFYLLARSMFASTGLIAGFAFPFSVNFGILAFFSPGGLGVRESAMVGFLTQINMPLSYALMISIVARIWFTIGEVFTFALGVILNKSLAKSEDIDNLPDLPKMDPPSYPQDLSTK